MLELMNLLQFVGVAAVATAGWLLSLLASRSAARRHFVLCATLATCLLLPVVLNLRAATRWTLLAIPAAGASSPQNDRSPPRSLNAAGIRLSGSVTNAAGHLSDPVTAEGGRPMSPASAGPVAAMPPSVRTEPVAKSAATPSWWSDWNRFGQTAYLAVAFALLLRNVVHLALVLKLKQQAVLVDSTADGIAVAEANVAVPLAVGFGRGMIVLPRGFRNSIDSADLADVLTHEAAHLKRGDHWIMLLQQLLAAAYWPIVPLHLVNRALSRSREELCDNAVLAKRDPVLYGQTLLAIAERVAAGRLAAVRLAPSMIGPGELERRVAGLLDHRRDRRTHVSRPLRWLFAGLLLGGSLLAVTTRVVAVEQKPPQAPNLKAADKPAQTAAIRWTGIPKVDREHPAVQRGVVLAPDGQPLAGAAVYAASSIELLELEDAAAVTTKDLGPVRAVTDAEGRFEFTTEDLTWVTPAGVRKRWETLLVATKEGLAPGWLKTFGDDRTLRSHWNPHPSREVAVRMRPPASLTGRLLLAGSGPLQGARVRLTGLMAPVEYDLEQHIAKQEQKELGLFSSIDYAEQIYRPWILPGLQAETTTDAEGRFELTGLPDGYLVRLEVTHPQAVTFEPRVAIRPIESVYRQPFANMGEPQLTLYGSGFTAELKPGAVLQGQVVSSIWGDHKAAVGVTVGQANHNSATGMSGQQFTTDAEGRFSVTGLPPRPEGYELAFAGSFAAPWCGYRQAIVPGQEIRVELTPAIPYRLTLTDPQGNPVDRDIFSITVQQNPGLIYRDSKTTFNVPERVAPGIYQGIVRPGPAAVLVKRRKLDRPAAVNPKEFFEPGRSDWTLEEERYSYGDAWHIAGAAVSTTDRLAVNANPLYEQLDLAAAILTNARSDSWILELKAVVHPDPPVEFKLVDEAGQPVENARIARQLSRYDADELPSEFQVYGLHPERAEFLTFRQEERGLIATLAATWTDQPVKVTLRKAATLRGQFVNKAGELNFDFGARVFSNDVPPDTSVFGRMYNITTKPGERNGEFELVVPPGVELRGEFVRKSGWHTRPTVGIAFGPLTPEPGQLIDLGNLVVP